jgi:hypothetical protein
MATILEVRQQIRFGLDQLRARNAHHEFEHLCRDLTRSRICSNILPATGPVSAGGDQGRDFETFRTYLRSTPVVGSTFIGLAKEHPLVFACTTQTKNVSSKIRADVGVIAKGGGHVEDMYCFCTQDVPIAERHALQEWAKKEHKIRLEILDGLALSEMLSERDVFWIAQQYLHIPADVYPRVPADQESAWYENLLSGWRGRTPRLHNYSDFAEIKFAVRRATFTPEIKQDIPFWIALLELYRTEASPLHLQRRATYEIAVASLRGLGRLFGQEDRIREYFRPLAGLETTDDLMDASCLLSYCTGAFLGGEVGLSADEIDAWRATFTARLEELLQAAVSYGTKAHLAMLRGAQELFSTHPPTDGLIPDGAMTWWLRVPRFARNAPLFPISGFSDYLTAAVRFIGVHPKYDKLVSATDRLVSKRMGAAAAGEKCRDRALAFHEQGKLLRAIRELHKAKIEWFSDEALSGSILAMLLIADWYCELGLTFAGKYYAMAAAWAAIGSSRSEDRQHGASALRAAAMCDYRQGAWCSVPDLVAASAETEALFSSRSTLEFEKEELDQFARNLVTMVVLGRRIAPELSGFLDGFSDFVKMAEWGETLAPATRTHWDGISLDDVWKQMQEQLPGRPFGDVGAMREVLWPELGITWSVRWKNDYAHTAVGEQFVAALQILLADLAEAELCLLETEVTVTLELGDVDSCKLDYQPSNKQVAWVVTLPEHVVEGSELSAEVRNALAAAGTVFSCVSMLPQGNLDRELQESFRQGISSKVFVVRSYGELYQAFVDRDQFEATERHTKAVPLAERNFHAVAHKELAWRGGPGPGYSRAEAERLLTNRYSKANRPIRLTLRRLRADIKFRLLVRKLREEGWLDWHILAVLSSIAINYRAWQVPELVAYRADLSRPLFVLDERDGDGPGRIAPRAREGLMILERLTGRFGDEEESATSIPIPLNEFSEDRIRQGLSANMLSTVKVLGLENRLDTPVFAAVKHLLANRYGYFSDDIQHEDILG